MTIFIIGWIGLGVILWIERLTKYYDHPILRPGIVELIVLMLASPVMLLCSLLK